MYLSLSKSPTRASIPFRANAATCTRQAKLHTPRIFLYGVFRTWIMVHIPRGWMGCNLQDFLTPYLPTPYYLSGKILPTTSLLCAPSFSLRPQQQLKMSKPNGSLPKSCANGSEIQNDRNCTDSNTVRARIVRAVEAGRS